MSSDTLDGSMTLSPRGGMEAKQKQQLKIKVHNFAWAKEGWDKYHACDRLAAPVNKAITSDKLSRILREFKLTLT